MRLSQRRTSRLTGLIVASLAVLLLGGGIAAAQGTGTVNVKQNAKLGAILADAHGMTLYHLTRDSATTSTCISACAQLWPPLTTSGESTLGAGLAGTLGVITRPDGTKQLTYNGMPLYTYAADKDPGDAYGQGAQGVWFVVRAETAAAPTATATRLPKTGADPLDVVFGVTLLSAGCVLLVAGKRRWRRG